MVEVAPVRLVLTKNELDSVCEYQCKGPMESAVVENHSSGGGKSTCPLRYRPGRISLISMKTLGSNMGADIVESVMTTRQAVRNEERVGEEKTRAEGQG